MDNLKTKFLFISLIIILFGSVYAITAADSDIIISSNHDVGLSQVDETVDIQTVDVQTVDQDEDLSQVDENVGQDSGLSQVDESADQDNNLSDNNSLKDDSSKSKKALKEGADDEDEGENEDGSSVYKIKAHMVTMDGETIKTQNNPFSKGTGGTMNLKKLNAFTAIMDNKNRNFTYDGNRYVFTHWVDDDGVVVDSSYKKSMKADGKNHTLNYYAQYDVTPLGSLRVDYIDNFANGGGSENHSADNVKYEHTFKEPADIPDEVEFLYWEREDTGEKFNPGDKLTVNPSEYAGKKLEIKVYAVYNIKTKVSVEDVSDYTGEVVDITADVTDAFGNPLNGGTATLTIDYDNDLSKKLGASSETYTAKVSDGKAEFKDITLGAPGTYPSKVEYTGYDDPSLKDGRNAYLASEGEGQVDILKLNTTTESDDVSGTAGDKVDITADITDQNDDPVQNGTAVLKVNGKEYTAEVKDGKSTFTGVELTESTEATIEYEGNDYYNPSNTTIKITVDVPDDSDDSTPDSDDSPDTDDSTPDSDDSSPDNNESSTPDEPKSEPNHSKITEKVKKAAVPALGNPIFLVMLASLALVSAVFVGRKK